MSLGEYRHPEGQVVFYLNIYKSSASFVFVLLP